MIMKNLTNNQWAFFVARVTMGINFLFHGIVRLPKLSGFAEGLSKGFAETLVPPSLVYPFAYGLPIVEFILGLLLLIGFKTRFAAIAGGLLIAFIMLGTCLKEDWPLVGSQLIYALFFFLLIKNLDHNALSIDSKNRTKVDGFSN